MNQATAGRFMITGARGQLGIALQRSAAASGKLHSVDALDITDAAAIEQAVSSFEPTAIINCAAYTAVDRAENDAELARRVNRDGAAHLAQAAARCGARMVHISTDFVFDGRKSSPYLPDDATHPLGVYGQSKLEGEHAVRAAGGDALIVRTAWLYSAHGNNFVKTMLRLMREKPQLGVVADQVGSPTCADTLAAALWKLLDAQAAAGTYHYTDAGVASWYDFAVAIRELGAPIFGELLAPVVPIRTQDYPTPAARPPYSVLDKAATSAIIGPIPHWREPLREVLWQLRAG